MPLYHLTGLGNPLLCCLFILNGVVLYNACVFVMEGLQILAFCPRTALLLPLFHGWFIPNGKE